MSFFETVGSAAQSWGRDSNSRPSSVAPDDWAKIAASAQCWAQSGDAFFGVSKATKKLPSGAYRCRASNQGPYLEKMPIQIDQLLALPDSTTEKLLAEFKHFWTQRENFSSRGFVFKRGMLLWGPPGSGKTSAIWQMTQALVKDHDGVVVFVEEPTLATICIGLLRRIEPKRPLICIMEDLDALVREHGEHGYLALLDGEVQISNVVHVATTNYPELLDRRFVDRPSRFDTIMEVGMPSHAARREYLKRKETTLDEMTLERWTKRSEGMSVAHLRELIIAIKCFEQTEDEAFGRMEEMRARPPKSTFDGLGQRRVGFGGNQ